MPPVSPPTPLPRRANRSDAARPSWAWAATLAFLAAAALLAHGPIQQWPGYHVFADVHTLWGLPNALNVLSNLPFTVVGLGGLAALWRSRRHGTASRQTPSPGLAAWALFAFAVACTTCGSAYYHWAPDNSSLVWDRLPIAWACAALSCGLLAERVHPRFGSAWSLTAALALGSASVGLWWWTLAPQGALEGGDLRAYLFVQFLPMLLIPALMHRPALHPQALGGRAAWTALALYAAAKGFELGDHAVMQALHAMGGHPLKHLLAAAGAAVLLWAVAYPSSPQGRGGNQLR